MNRKSRVKAGKRPRRVRSAVRSDATLSDYDFTGNFRGSIFRLVREPDGTLHMPFVRSSLARPDGLRRDEQEVQAVSPLRGVHAEDLPMVRETIERSARDLTPYRIECRAEPSGTNTVRWVHVSATPQRSPDGRVEWNGVAMDITDLKVTSEELQESKRKLATLMSNLPGMVYRCKNDRDWSMEFVSDGCRELTGYAADDLIGNKTVAYNNLIHPDDRDRIWEEVQAGVRAKRPFRLEYRIRTRGGEEKWVWEQGRGVFAAQEELLALEGFISDNTEKRRLEDEMHKAQRLEAIGLLAGGIAHDFNNVLMGIVGNLSLAKHALPDDSPQRAQLQEAENACGQATYLTHQLLTFARGGAPVRTIVQVGQLLEEVVTFALRGSRVQLQWRLDRDLWPALVDRGQMSQVIQNIVINAKQAMPEGGTLRVSAGNTHLAGTLGEPPDAVVAGDYLRIMVEDEGIGIAPEHLPRIFEPFFTTKPEGTGLGLATSYSIVRRHGGRISARSKVGRGSVFEIYLPARPGANQGAGLGAERAAPYDGRGKRVLVMDDDATVRVVLGAMLKQLGYAVELTAGASEAVEKCERAQQSGAPFQVALLDLTITGPQSGERVVERLRRVDPSIKAIVASGYSRDPVMAEYEQHGYQGVLSKPFQIEQLGALLDRVVGSGPAR